ncbi:MAG: PepSY domain-containing protein [Pseudobdellovibrio sp.]
MKKFMILALTLLSTAVFAKTECTTEPKDKWQSEEAFKAKVTSEGYKIKKFKVTSGNCYEIYGHNKEGKKVEIYYNPITFEIVKQK